MTNHISPPETSPARIALYGATGYTGRLVAEELRRRGRPPLLIGRDRGRVEQLAAKLGGPPTAVVPANDRDALAAELAPGDVLISTVGPFTELGVTAVEAAIAARSHYLDSNGEPGFTREIFERAGPKAARAGVAMVSSCAPEWVLGNAAGAIALGRAPDAVRVDVGYFVLDHSGAPLGLARQLRGFAGASLASGVELVGRPSFAWRDDRLITERWARRRRAFAVEGRGLVGVSHGGTEHFALPRRFPRLREVNVYLGWFSPWGRRLQLVSILGGVLVRPRSLRRTLQRPLARSRPSGELRDQSRSLTVASAHDAEGSELARVVLDGPDLYSLTAHLLAWGATELVSGRVEAAGALGPVETFGLDRLIEALEEAGVRIDATSIAASTPA